MKLFCLFACLGLCLAVPANKTAAKKTVVCDRNVFDNCALKMAAFGDKGMHWPTNTEEMNTRCKENIVLEKCAKDYASKCLRAESRNSVLVILFGVSKTNRAYCRSAKRKNAFISFGSCANKVNEKWTTVIEKANREFHGAAIYENAKLRIPLACCIYHKYRQLVADIMEEEKCEEKAIAEADKVMDSYGRDGLSLLCSDYEPDSDKCEQIIDRVPNYNQTLNSKAFLLGIADIFNSLQ